MSSSGGSWIAHSTPLERDLPIVRAALPTPSRGELPPTAVAHRMALWTSQNRTSMSDCSQTTLRPCSPGGVTSPG